MMKRILSLLVLLSTLLAPGSWSAAAPATTTEMIVVVKAGRSARGLATAFGVTPRYVYTAALNGFAAALTPQQHAGLARHADVALVEADQMIAAATTQTINTASGLWGLDRIDQHALPLSGSYSYTATGTGVTAYIIDSGLQANHAEFGGRAQNVFDAFGGSGADCHGHGTHVASLVGGTTYGVAKGAQLRGVRVLDCVPQGTIANAIAGIDWVAANAQKPAVATLAFTPVNLTSSNSVTLQLAVENLISSGVFVAVAAGNSNADACALAPANVAAAYTVAATTRTDARATFSNFGACVDGYAPGTDITGAWIGSTINTVSGTSAAAGFVAGAATLYKAAYGDAIQATITTWLNTNATANVVTSNPTGTPNRLLYWPGIPGAVSAGYHHSCGVRTNGNVVCWGRNTDGQATVPSGMFTQVSGGYYHTCARRTDGTVTCWGSNAQGQAAPPSGTFAQISAGREHTCGIRTDGTVACWGRNEYGQAYQGRGRIDPYSRPELTHP